MERRHYYFLTALQTIAAGGMFWFLFAWRHPWTAQRYVGTVLVVVGVCFIIVARYQLGRSFSIEPEAHALVTTGLYSKIRNPIYVFGGVILAGLILVVGRPGGWLVLLAAAVGQTIRARREARVLEAAFGDAYREYRRKTWF
jgi:protein-S-isoprenylcysteine O-methyltransferase Ste14